MTGIMFIDDFVPVPRTLLATNAWLLSDGPDRARAGSGPGRRRRRSWSWARPAPGRTPS